jgi:hypothetical protein
LSTPPHSIITDQLPISAINHIEKHVIKPGFAPSPFFSIDSQLIESYEKHSLLGVDKEYLRIPLSTSPFHNFLHKFLNPQEMTYINFSFKHHSLYGAKRVIPIFARHGRLIF